MTMLSLFNLVLRNLSTASGSRTAGSSGLRARLRQFRRDVLPTHDELDAAYLDGSCDLHELEARMRDLDRPRRSTCGMLRHHYQRNE
jgi:hypothetical protein